MEKKYFYLTERISFHYEEGMDHLKRRYIDGWEPFLTCTTENYLLVTMRKPIPENIKEKA